MLTLHVVLRVSVRGQLRKPQLNSAYPHIYVFHHPRALSRVSLSSERQTAPAELCLRVIRSKYLQE